MTGIVFFYFACQSFLFCVSGYNNQTVVASLLINPYTLVLNGEEKKVRYIVGVSVFPEHRGKGYSSFLMKQTLSLLQECKDELVLLMPIDTSIYRRYGFINTFFDHSFKMELGKVLFDM